MCKRQTAKNDDESLVVCFSIQYSSRPVYSGVVEVSIYIGTEFRGMGISVFEDYFPRKGDEGYIEKNQCKMYNIHIEKNRYDINTR